MIGNMSEYIKEFDQWNKKKKETDQKPIDRRLFFYAREVWWCSVGVNVGSEVDGKNENFERPVLIVRVISGNGFFGIPLTTKEKGHKYEVALRHTKGVSYANVSQLKFFSSKRLLRKVGTGGEEDFEKVMRRLKELFG